MNLQRARRALLYVPGSETKKIAKAAGLGADSVCLDLEDGVAPDKKIQARAEIARALAEIDFGKSERLVRINAVGSGLETQDLELPGSRLPEGVVIPKVADADQVKRVSAQLAALEAARGLATGTVYLIGMIESARGIVNLPTIASADPRLQALIFGAEDYAADVGATRTPVGEEVLYARSAIVTACAAFGLQAIDLLFLDFHDADGLRAEAARGARLGYAGMQVIHPNQVPVVQEAFTPGDAQIEQAKRIVAAAQENLGAGRGAFALDNKMVDMPIIKAAERVLARARAAGKA